MYGSLFAPTAKLLKLELTFHLFLILATVVIEALAVRTLKFY
jgi:hypothetical protein